MKETIKSLVFVFVIVFIAFGIISGVSYFAWKHALQERMTSMGDNTAKGMVSFNPDIDIIDENQSYSVVLDLPGLTKDSIEIKFVNGELIVSGFRSINIRKKPKSFFLRRECGYGRFSRNIALPQDVDPAGISSEYDQGVLTVILPKGSSSVEKKSDTSVKIK